MPLLKIACLTFKHSDLVKFSEDERVALFQLAQLHNELLWTQKHLLWVWNKRDGEQAAETDARVFAYISTMGRFSGQLRETYKTILKVYRNSRLSQVYHPKLPAESREALDWLGRYYGSRNTVMDIRDRMAFHFDPSLIKEALLNIPQDHEHVISLGAHSANTFFNFAHSVNAQCLFSLTGKNDVEAALSHLADEVVGSVADKTFFFLTGFLITVLKEISVEQSSFELNNPYRDCDVHLPFFMSPPTSSLDS